MSASLSHRGPNDEGAWSDPDTGLALSSRRLAILDLSSAGHQPMLSPDGRYVLAFNGEIYNYLELKRELEKFGTPFRGHSDTEVMLAAFDRWGLETSLERFNGMFGFALWDRDERRLHLGRDRLGEKPLYYGWSGDAFLFGSELKALRAHPAFSGEIDRQAISLLLKFGYIPAPVSIYRGIFKLTAGSLLTLTSASSRPEPKKYWSAEETAIRGSANPLHLNESEAVHELDRRLRDSVKHRMIADVPLGAFLSGGIDSSTVVALMQAQSSRPVKTFTVGFREDEFNEAGHARDVARHLGTDHTELYLSPGDALAVIPELSRIYDEPFADSSQIPTYLVSRLAKQDVTVALSGDGGDELFAGYDRYAIAEKIWTKIESVPPSVRGLATAGIRSLSTDSWDRIFRGLSPLIAGRLKHRLSGDRMDKMADLLGSVDFATLYLDMLSLWKRPEALVRNAQHQTGISSAGERWSELPDRIHAMMLLDTMTYLPDDILVKVDRASMAVSLEARVPLLDHTLVEWCWQLPFDLKMRNGHGKHILRSVLERYVPKSLVDRPKMGFGIPLKDWLRGPLRAWAQDLLNEDRLKHDGFFNPVPITQKLKEHLDGTRNWHYHLWPLLVFQSWLEQEEKQEGEKG